MSLDNVADIFMLLTTIVGLLAALFHYIAVPKRGWLFLTVYFLAHLLSDYYWTTYTLVVHDFPDASEIIAYIGWNIGYIFLVLAILHMREKASARFFHPLMLLPIPINAVQFVIYIQFGAVLNNTIQVSISTVVSVLSLQGILYYWKNRKNGACFPYLQVLVFVFVITEYAMWTASCYDWPSDFLNPYYYSSFANYLIAVFFAWAVKKQYEVGGFKAPVKSVTDVRFQTLIQAIISIVVCGGCLFGFFMTERLKSSISHEADQGEVYGSISLMLFAIAIFLIILILITVIIAYRRFRNRKPVKEDAASFKRNRFNLVFTMVITLALLIFAVVYNSKLFYGASVTSVYEDGEDEILVLSTEIENYLTLAKSTLKVSADTVNLMIKDGEDHQKIYNYLVDQTKVQSKEFDEYFTGIYAYIDGKYMDGSGWIPDVNFQPETREWYKKAVEAGGKTVLVSPYVDAQTNSVVITVCKMISDNEDSVKHNRHNIVCLDVIVDHIQEVTEHSDLAGRGFAMILSSDGMIVAHHDPENSGQSIGDVYDEDVLSLVRDAGENRTIEAEVNGEDCTLFFTRVADQWYVVLTVSNAEMFQDVYSQILVNIFVILTVFALIAFFIFLGYRNEQNFGRRIEEMKITEQKKEYEAEVLKLEKTAADEANKAKSSFLADMSHEIRTPINAILGMNEMILRESSNKSVLEYAKNVDISGKNLLQLINGILDFSKIEDGKMEIVPVAYPLGNMITNLDNSIHERARSKGLKMIFDVDPSLPSELIGDDIRVTQVIINLLTNAVKYTPEGSVTFTMKERERTEDKVLLYVEVRDTGIGIRESDMKSLFESFERLDLQKNRTIEGTGLGMSITTNLLHLMNSELKVESTYGEGSVFSFELWQGIENDEPMGEYRKELTDDDIETYEELFTAPEAQILLVDDTSLNIVVGKNLLKKTEVQIDTASSGEEAVRLASGKSYDIILMDQRMPGMDGTQALWAIRDLENGKNKETPVICLTADAIRGAKKRYIREGFTDYLTKPVDGRELERMLFSYLPKEKIKTEEKEVLPDVTEDTSRVNQMISGLIRGGIDTAAGLAFCRDDEGLYREILKQYAIDYVHKRKQLDLYYEQRDWDNYGIQIHSVKGISKQIGALELSDRAAELERATNNGKEKIIDHEHESVMNLYDEVVGHIRESIGLSETDVTEAPVDDEVIEFEPVK